MTSLDESPHRDRYDWKHIELFDWKVNRGRPPSQMDFKDLIQDFASKKSRRRFLQVSNFKSFISMLVLLVLVGEREM